MKRLLLASILLASCATRAPDGWTTSDAARIESATQKALGLLCQPQGEMSDVSRCAILAGETVASVSRQLKDKGVAFSARIIKSIRVADKVCRTAYPAVMRGQTLGAVCRKALGYPGETLTDAEAVQALALAVATGRPP